MQRAWWGLGKLYFLTWVVIVRVSALHICVVSFICFYNKKADSSVE